MKLLQTSNEQYDPNQVAKKETRDGFEIDKGAVVTEEIILRNEDLIQEYISFWTAYPDLFLDMIKPKDSNFSLFFFQRIVLRVLMRYKDVYLTATRGGSKSFLTIMAQMLQCIFFPGTKRFICAPRKNQGAQIAKEKIVEIYNHFPLIRKEIVGGHITDMPGNFGKDYVNLAFRNGSQFDVVGALDSTRGGRRHGGLIDEIRKLYKNM